jgi:DNA-binding transcriptional ArsR family regulator
MVHISQKIMEYLGLRPERLRIQFMSGAEGSLFVDSVNDFVKQVKALGPLGEGEGLDEEGLKSKLETVTGLIPYIRLVERERLRLPAMTEEEVHQFFAGDELKRLFDQTILEKLAIGQIVSLLRKGPLTTREIAQGVGLTPSEISKHLSTSSRHRLVRYDEGQKRYALA